MNGETVLKNNQPRKRTILKMTGIGTMKPQAIQEAQEELRRADVEQWRADKKLRRQLSRLTGQTLEATRDPMPQPPGPQPRTGLWRCGKSSSCPACATPTCKSSGEEQRKENGCPCHGNKACAVRDQIAPCWTSYDSEPPSQRALALGWSSGLGTSSASSAAHVDGGILGETMKRLGDTTEHLNRSIDKLIGLVEAEEGARNIRLQHLPGLQVKHLVNQKKEALVSMDEVLEEATVQVERLQKLEELEVVETEPNEGHRVQANLKAFEDPNNVKSRQHHIAAAAGTALLTLPGSGQRETLDKQGNDLDLLALLEGPKAPLRPRTLSTIPLAGDLQKEHQPPFSAPPFAEEAPTAAPKGAYWAGYDALSPRSQAAWREGCRQKDNAPTEALKKKEEAAAKANVKEPTYSSSTSLQEWRERIGEMQISLQHRSDAISRDIHHREGVGTASSGWVSRVQEDLKNLELGASAMGQSVEDYGKFQGTTEPGRFREAGAAAVTGICKKTAELRRRISAIPSQAEVQSSHQGQNQAHHRKSGIQEDPLLQQLYKQNGRTPQPQVNFLTPEVTLHGSLPCSGSALTVGAGSSTHQASAIRREVSDSGDPSWGRHQAFLPRATLPSFSGRVTEWAEFRRRFAAMADGQYTAPIYLMQLEEKLPEEGRCLLFGVQIVEEAWDALEHFYGNRQVIVASVVEELLMTKLSGGTPYGKLEKLAQAVQKAISSMRSVEAEQDLHTDQRLVAALIAKLPPYYTLEWDRHNAFTQPEGFATWEKFVLWLRGAREMARSARVRETQEAVFRSAHCSSGGAGGGHDKSKSVLSSFGALTEKEARPQDSRSQKLKTEEGCKILQVEDRLRSGPCPVCKQLGKEDTFHTYDRFFPAWRGKMEWPTQRLSSCETFSGMPPSERGKVLEKLQACGRCSSWMHSTARCPSNNMPGCQVKEGGQMCGGRHIEALHGGGSYISMGLRVGGGEAAGIGKTQKVQGSLQPPPTALTASGYPGHPSLLAVHLVPAVGKHGVVHLLNTMSDEGSQVTLLTKRAAERLHLGPRRPWTLYLQVVGSQYRPLHTTLHKIRLRDAAGQTKEVTAATVESIASCGSPPD